jgi:hypothetical protein
MKKKFTRPDGTEVELEGSAEELAAYERALSQGREPVVEAPKTQRRVLTEDVARIAKALEEMRDEQARQGLNPWREIYRPLPQPVWPDWDPNPKITWEVTSDSFTISDCRIDPSLKRS